MFNFLKNWFDKDQKNMRSVDELKKDLSEKSDVPAKVEGREGTTAQTEDANEAKKTMVGTELSLHPAWEANLDSEKKYSLRFLETELPQMIKGTVGVTGFSLVPQEGGITVALFFRNGTPNPFFFKTTTLTLLVDDNVFARHEFDLSDLESIPAYSSRPWEVFFPEESFLAENLAFSRWKVQIHLGKKLYSWPKTLDLDLEMEKRMTETQKAKLELLAEKLPFIRKEEVEITAFDISKMKNGGLFIGLLFRNGKTTPYTASKMKITVTEGNGDIIASGIIDTQGRLAVKPNTSRPWLVIFPPDVLEKENPDLRNWKLEVIEK